MNLSSLGCRDYSSTLSGVTMKIQAVRREWTYRFDFADGEVPDQAKSYGSKFPYRPSYAVVAVTHHADLDKPGRKCFVSSPVIYGHRVLKSGNLGQLVHDRPWGSERPAWLITVVREAEQLAKTELGI